MCDDDASLTGAKRGYGALVDFANASDVSSMSTYKMVMGHYSIPILLGVPSVYYPLL
jgi:hypothetical protein